MTIASRLGTLGTLAILGAGAVGCEFPEEKPIRERSIPLDKRIEVVATSESPKFIQIGEAYNNKDFFFERRAPYVKKGVKLYAIDSNNSNTFEINEMVVCGNLSLEEAFELQRKGFEDLTLLLIYANSDSLNALYNANIK